MALIRWFLLGWSYLLSHTLLVALDYKHVARECIQDKPQIYTATYAIIKPHAYHDTVGV